MARIYWDTNLFLYLFEDHPRWLPYVVAMREKMLARNDQLLTGALAVGEILARPEREGATGVTTAYQEFFRSGAVEVVPFDLRAAEWFGRIRGLTRTSAPDAIHLACAMAGGADLFVTNDNRLSRLALPGLVWITSLEQAIR